MSYSNIIEKIRDYKQIIPASTRDSELIAPADILFNTEQCFDDMFDPFYNFSIIDTKKLVEIIDKARINKGYKPMLGENNDEDCWYDFELMWDKSNDRVCITAMVWNSEDEDDGQYWAIELLDYEKEYILKMIKELMERTDKW